MLSRNNPALGENDPQRPPPWNGNFFTLLGYFLKSCWFIESVTLVLATVTSVGFVLAGFHIWMIAIYWAVLGGFPLYVVIINYFQMDSWKKKKEK